MCVVVCVFCFFQAEDGIRDLVRSRGLGDVYKRQDEQYDEFFRSVPEFEKMLVRSGIKLIKYWFSVSDEEQQLRFLGRIHDPLKQWKLSPMDLSLIHI